MKKVYLTILSFLIVASSIAQDIHYSQFANAPLLLNPAMTGLMAGDFRLGVNYRNQWFTATGGGFGRSPYMTTAFSADMPFRVKDDVIGGGLYIANDQAGANTFSTVIAVGSVSFIKTLGKKQQHRLSAGFQGGYTAQTIRIENFQFASQFEENVFNPRLSNNELIGKSKVGYLDLNAGMLWYGKFSDVFAMYAGGSFFNITTPKYDILVGQKRDLYWRVNVHTGIDVILAKTYHILPMLMYMQQGVDNQINCGLAFGADFKYEMKATLGLQMRVNTLQVGASADAIIPYLSYEIRGVKLGLSYDATISPLKSAAPGVGAFEIGIVYTGRKPNHYAGKKELISPRF